MNLFDLFQQKYISINFFKVIDCVEYKREYTFFFNILFILLRIFKSDINIQKC